MSSSSQICLPARVDTPFDLSVMRWIWFLLVTTLPREARPLMARSAKLYSSTSFLSFGRGRYWIRSTSASPLLLAVNQRTVEPGVPRVRSYSLSRVMPVMAKRLA